MQKLNASGKEYVMAGSTARWQGGLEFSVDQDGHAFTIDGSEEFGGRDRGPRPKNLLLTALIGCSGMDVVSILEKMKIRDFGLTISAHGEYTREHPRIFEYINIHYVFTGKELPRSKLHRAVTLSQEKYCGVTAILGKTAQINHEIIIRDTDG